VAALHDFWLLLGSAALAILIAGVLSPFEALGWWAGWFGDEASTPATEPAARDGDSIRHWLVFLTGIHSVSDETIAGRDKNLLAGLAEALPGVRLIEVFPYSASNRPLTGGRVLARFWRWALRMKLSQKNLAQLGGMFINLRNVWQVAVAADQRYGPLYNEATAQTISRALQQAGYRNGSGSPVTLIGYSGGGEVAAGASAYLKALVNAPVRVISLGGVMSSQARLPEIDGLHHLFGSRDRVHRLGTLLFPGRWKLFAHSAWNQAVRRGIIRLLPLGDVGHTGAGGYLDSKALLPDGRSHLQQTVDVIRSLIDEVTPPAPQPAADAATGTPPTPDAARRKPHPA
jgi:pimeloyl-ACP methyl ester carboxylesterase